MIFDETIPTQLAWLRRNPKGTLIDPQLPVDVIAQLVEIGALTYKPTSQMYEVGDITEDMIARAKGEIGMGDVMRRMFYVDATMKVDGGYTPCIIIEGDANFYPMRGNHELARPYIWGPTLEEAKRQADIANIESFRLSPEVQLEILSSVWAARDAEERLPSLVRDGEGAVGILRPVHGCAEPPVEGAVFYYLIRHAADDGEEWGEDFITKDWIDFLRRFRELTSDGVGVTSVEFLVGSPINMGRLYA